MLILAHRLLPKDELAGGRILMCLWETCTQVFRFWVLVNLLRVIFSIMEHSMWNLDQNPRSLFYLFGIVCHMMHIYIYITKTLSGVSNSCSSKGKPLAVTWINKGVFFQPNQKPIQPALTWFNLSLGWVMLVVLWVTNLSIFCCFTFGVRLAFDQT